MTAENILNYFPTYLNNLSVSQVTRDTYWSDVATAFRCHLSGMEFSAIEGILTDAQLHRSAWDVLRTVIEDTAVPGGPSEKRSSQVNLFEAFDRRIQSQSQPKEVKARLWVSLGAIVRAVLKSTENAEFEESLAKNHYTGNYTSSLNHMRRADEESYFVHGLPDATAAPDPEPSDDEYELSDEDSRELVQRQIRERRGQQKFRDGLLHRYEHRCVVTGCTVVAVLEAAHIRPYRRADDNHVENGLLLRADIHTLFDLNLLGIEPGTWLIHTHPRLEQNYAEFTGQTLLLPAGIEPSTEAVQSRFEQFQDNLSSE